MRLLSSVRTPAAGAVLGQGTQALAGLVLQVAAARYLGAAGLAVFAVGYGLLVLATAVCSGMVGDSLTVLDRTDPPVRAALLGWTASVSGAAALLGAAVASLSGALPLWAGLLAGLATAAFVVEDTLRRLLMATGRFWSLPAVDGTSLVLALGVLAAVGAMGGLTLGSFVVALLVGQTGAALVAWWRLPADERPRGPWRPAAWRTVFDFGVWRALAQTIRPTLLTALRLLVVAVAGAAAYGPVEAARVLTAPTLVLVTGLGSFLLPRFVAMRRQPAAAALRTADRAAVGLALAVAGTGALTVLALPLVGPVVTGNAYAIPVGAVVGWSAYAVGGALLLPYSALATVHRRHRRVLALRSLELLSLAVVLVLVLLVEGGASWAPLALTLGPVLVAVAVRAGVLLPVVRADGAGPRALVATG
ncbi:oligosaccharide flippase family protein [Geodermatophilus sp. DSM 44513]|uniref:oligosaccharide flippase family protein n=1 Tax=Geodermatophilus sp. DSM 44513 TaxID=1528104 RepID=UPI00128072E3|nr:oligosaccharide flippase family protein [Geodermatophilus sp. DSM 44513]WNV76402.1 oligosaccharide flippase family protein [Geodermatophilus sp. DSM 44513]